MTFFYLAQCCNRKICPQRTMFSQTRNREKECSGIFSTLPDSNDYFMCSSIYPRAHRVQSLTCSGKHQKNRTVCRINSLFGFLLARNPENPESREMYIAELILQASAYIPQFSRRWSFQLNSLQHIEYSLATVPANILFVISEFVKLITKQIVCEWPEGTEVQPHISIAWQTVVFRSTESFLFNSFHNSSRQRRPLINIV